MGADLNCTTEIGRGGAAVQVKVGGKNLGNLMRGIWARTTSSVKETR